MVKCNVDNNEKKHDSTVDINFLMLKIPVSATLLNKARREMQWSAQIVVDQPSPDTQPSIKVVPSLMTSSLAIISIPVLLIMMSIKFVFVRYNPFKTFSLSTSMLSLSNLTRKPLFCHSLTLAPGLLWRPFYFSARLTLASNIAIMFRTLREILDVFKMARSLVNGIN
uniref:Uncharacterized protein n=1 Tax=Romanomermis culicivorax TaxID=13658 RepID=A0A915IV46_ROMCU